MPSRPETIRKMKIAQKMYRKGLSYQEISEYLAELGYYGRTQKYLSTQRIRELVMGKNWYSKEGVFKDIK